MEKRCCFKSGKYSMTHTDYVSSTKIGENLIAILSNTTKLKMLHKESCIQHTYHRNTTLIKQLSYSLNEKKKKRPNLFNISMLFQKHHQDSRDLIINWSGLMTQRILLSTKRESVQKHPETSQKSCELMLFLLFLKEIVRFDETSLSQWFQEFYIPINSVIDKSIEVKGKSKADFVSMETGQVDFLIT